MPELPEVETTRLGVSPHVLGRQVTNLVIRQSQLRWPIPEDLAEQLHRRKLIETQRRGKYLLFKFSHGFLIIHLGMSGSLRICHPDDSHKKHDHVDIIFSGNHCLRYHDPRRFGAILWTANLAEHPLLCHLGPEPLSEDFSGDYLFAKSRKRSKDVKSFIMDSRIVVGVGNIYANEALFSAGIRPTKAAGKVSRASYERLGQEIQLILAKAIKQGGTTLRDFVGGDGKPGYFAQQLLTYGRGGKACVNCGKTLKEIRIAQRSTVFCSHCQK